MLCYDDRGLIYSWGVGRGQTRIHKPVLFRKLLAHACAAYVQKGDLPGHVQNNRLADALGPFLAWAGFLNDSVFHGCQCWLQSQNLNQNLDSLPQGTKQGLVQSCWCLFNLLFKSKHQAATPK